MMPFLKRCWAFVKKYLNTIKTLKLEFIISSFNLTDVKYQSELKNSVSPNRPIKIQIFYHNKDVCKSLLPSICNS